MQAFIGIIIFSISLFFSCLSQAKEVLVVTVDWPPYCSPSSPDGGPFSIITQEAFKVKGHTVKIIFLPWKRAFWEVNYGRADMILSAYYTKERAKKYIYSDQIYAVREYVIGLKSTNIHSFNTLKELQGYTFGTTLGYAYSKEFDAATYLSRKESSSDYLNVKKLFEKQVHFVVMSQEGFKATVKQLPKESHQDYVLLSPPLSMSGIYNLVSKKNHESPQLLKDFNFGLKSIKESGLYDKIMARFNLKE